MANKLIKTIKRSSSIAYRLLFPTTCTLCFAQCADSFALCGACQSELPFNKGSCVSCALTFPCKIPHHCGQCLTHPPPYDYTVSAFNYASPVNFLISQLKFHGKLHHAKLLGHLLTKRIVDHYQNNHFPEVIIPVPLHYKRLRERGYNQALEIARFISRDIKIPIDVHSVKRIRHTIEQSSLSGRKRQTNVKNAFECTHIPYQHVAILDDIVTSTNTVREVSRCLRAAGVKEIAVWCCARTQKSRKKSLDFKLN